MNNRPRRRRRIVWIVAALLLVIVPAACVYTLWQGSHDVITVVNQSGMPVDDVEVTVGTDPARYALGRIPQGASRSVRVFPHGDSGYGLRFSGPDNRPISWTGGYMEGTGYHNRLTITKNKTVVDKERLWP